LDVHAQVVLVVTVKKRNMYTAIKTSKKPYILIITTKWEGNVLAV